MDNPESSSREVDPLTGQVALPLPVDNTGIEVFDNRIGLCDRNKFLNYCYRSKFVLGWNDSDEHEKNIPNLYSWWTPEDLEETKLKPYIDACIEECSWFVCKKHIKTALNIVSPGDIHYTPTHYGEQVALYYVNLDWRDGWYGETMFYDPYDSSKIVYTSSYKPGRIVLFDGRIPHSIRPQSSIVPKFRLTVSLFYTQD